ncbi:MAG TPA: ABC transporter substrate-binding protein [Candidatus Ozemobacteraceae bacterium]|nr:ABC transporter substrate-binding protein [Candidatus Ozemobacteraceae bacterium]
MRKLLFLTGIAILLCLVLLQQSRSFEAMGERRLETLNTPSNELLVGVCWPFSTNEDGMADGIRLAQEEINAQNLASGVQIRLEMRDDASSWEKAHRIAVEFSANPRMAAVIGFYDSSIALRSSVMFERSNLPHILIGANNTALTTYGQRYLVRTIISNEKIGAAMAQIAINYGKKRIAVIAEDGAYGEDLSYHFRKVLDEQGGTVVYQHVYSRGHADFRLPANELKEIRPDLIFFGGIEPWAGDFLHELRSIGVKSQVVGAFTLTPEMRRRAGSAIENAMFFDFYDMTATSPQNIAFVDRFRKKYGKDPDTWAAQGYDALYILANAYNTANSQNPLDLSYAIRYMDPWVGANGRYDFDSRGELGNKPLYLKIVLKDVPYTFRRSTDTYASSTWR